MKAEVYRTFWACPSQWKGELEDGRAIYIRFRFGKLQVGFGNDISEAITNTRVVYTSDDSWNGFMADEEMIEIVRKKLGIEAEVLGEKDI